MEDVGDLYAVVLGLGGLGLVGIVFYGLDYPGDVVWVSGLHPCESTTI